MTTQQLQAQSQLQAQRVLGIRSEKSKAASWTLAWCADFNRVNIHSSLKDRCVVVPFWSARGLSKWLQSNGNVPYVMLADLSVLDMKEKTTKKPVHIFVASYDDNVEEVKSIPPVVQSVQTSQGGEGSGLGYQWAGNPSYTGSGASWLAAKPAQSRLSPKMSSSSEDKGQGIWSLLPSFDPAQDNVREYIEKVKFLEAICPDKDKGMLAPRLAMLCRGIAWGQVKAISPEKLTDKETGVQTLLAALASWEETSEMKTYELFEKAIYKTTQKSDESATSFVNRLQVAMDELGKVTVKEFHAFLLLRQSSLTAEDKKRVLTMTGGAMETTKVEQSMRTLATTILSTEPKKKVYPTNFVETEPQNGSLDDDSNMNNAYYVHTEEEDALSAENLEYLAQGGGEDALLIQQFEKDFEDMVQDIPDLQTALVSYQEARQRISERRRSRGFWPSKSRGKGGRDHAKGHRKGGHRSTKDELLERISRTHCKICGARGHWKAECPRRDMQQQSREQQANVVHVVEGGDDPNFLQVLICLKVFPMPTRQEVLEGFRVLAEEILASLRLLFQMLFTMTRATSPEETVSEQEMNPIHQLVAEVKLQRQKISELGLLITGQQMTQGVPNSPPRSSGPPSEIWEAIEMEGLGVPMEEQGPSQAAQVLSSSPRRALSAQTYGGKPTMKIAGMPARSECRTQQQSGGPDPCSSGFMGTTSDYLGKEVQGSDIRRDLRARPKLCQVDPGQSRFPQRGHGKFRKLLSDPQEVGGRGTPATPELREWQPIPEKSVRFSRHVKSDFHIEDHEEVMWMKEVYKLIPKGNNRCRPLDVLEIYAYPNSQLTSIAQASGLRAERFTFEDGDLSTVSGRVKLLTTVMLKQPRHVWLAPDCGPWSPWSRFNALRSVQGFHRVDQAQMASLVHLKLRNLICKIQLSAGRHAHIENPWTSGIWGRRELADFLTASLPARLDQCMFSLRHPETKDPMEKKT
eukprot:s850_g3.t1